MELMVVVGIITILVSMAVPAMMTFHVRSKVARTLADMRTMRMALEAYASENNDYPLMRGQVVSPDGTVVIPRVPRPAEDFYHPPGKPPQPCGGGFRTIPLELTTPMAYISNPPRDVFKYGRHFLNDGHGILIPVEFDTGYMRTLDYIYVNLEEFVAAKDPDYTQEQIGEFGKWMIFSVGPDTNLTDMKGNTPYDPTNGTVSPGEIRTYATYAGGF